MNVAQVLKKENIIAGLSAQSKNEALEKLVQILYEGGYLEDKDAFLADVLHREEISTTGIGNGIAIPHGKSSAVKETTVAIGRLTSSLEWESVDDKPVELLSEMARKLASEQNCKKLLDAKDAQGIIDVFSE